MWIDVRRHKALATVLLGALLTPVGAVPTRGDDSPTVTAVKLRVCKPLKM